MGPGGPGGVLTGPESTEMAHSDVGRPAAWLSYVGPIASRPCSSYCSCEQPRLLDMSQRRNKSEVLRIARALDALFQSMGAERARRETTAEILI